MLFIGNHSLPESQRCTTDRIHLASKIFHRYISKCTPLQIEYPWVTFDNRYNDHSEIRLFLFLHCLHISISFSQIHKTIRNKFSKIWTGLRLSSQYIFNI